MHMHTQYTKPPKLFLKEYASFRQDVVDYLVANIPKDSTLLDPMAGTAPLLPFTESRGIEAHFCDLLPVHFFVNSAKTVDVYWSLKQLEKGNKDYLRDKIAELLKPMRGSGLIISETWIDKNVVNSFRQAWQRTLRFSPQIGKLLRAALLLSVRHFSSLSTTGNSTWIKKGGMSSGEALDSVTDDISKRIRTYFSKAYEQSSLERIPLDSRCKFYLGEATALKIPKRKYVVITSPSFANRYDTVQAYFPELFLLHYVARCPEPTTLKGRILATNCVKGFEISIKDINFIKERSSSAYQFILHVREGVPKSRIHSENEYYFRYFVRYYKELFQILDRIGNYTDRGSEYFIVVQNNIHRGDINEMDRFLLEYFISSGFESRIAESWLRSHQGRRNISADRPLVVKKHKESIVWARRATK